MSETRIQSEILLEASRRGMRLFRNNVGKYQDARGSWIAYGVGGNGAGDLIGWTPVVITPDMVGQVVAVFTSVEVKTPTGRVRPDQQVWCDAVNKAGGRGVVARSAGDLV